jgi:serine phosphatase RsbU (regulator of sigma subunit)
MDMEPNAPIGLWPELDFVGETINDIRGRLLLVYTDGLNEAENKQQERFGDEHLLDILNAQRFDSAQQLVKYLEQEVEKHRDGAEPNDDLTMLCIFT